MKAINKRLRNKKGFTLIELIVVIAVLGILAMIAIPKITGIQDDAKENVDKQNVKLMQNAVEMYAAENGNYPANNEIKSVLERYIDKIPEPQQTGYSFWYNEGKIKYQSESPGNGWVNLNGNNENKNNEKDENGKDNQE
ncbi:prepilin-type N-terminal cleavage/methylation domain-containing protein [Caloranaerobacter azorensis]|uniref:Prepilin-type N-terminal cleavage/methylation domain-containing protein n=1 Tax=Caloranaerobacter azorensis TaxID=116090 RepID=A0A6P1YFJ9_9FIRM|nr:prepilin-type N-terminal cleavage/methylation domain-containing protein [Caloranaerobacter azorensis]